MTQVSSSVHIMRSRVFCSAVKDTLSGAFARIEPPRKLDISGDPGWSRSDAEERVSFTALQKTLLKIMSTLDDTCVIKRVGYERAQKVKREANASPSHADALKDMCSRYAREGISPGGAADMLALTIFIDSII